ncbi:MAG TPA: AAA family ATPase [Terracidiphilus sp.]|nr:AAA family ATPase [Terracidiphilus sp.]
MFSPLTGRMKQFEAFRLDSANGCLWRDGEQIDLPPKPFAVLNFLVENPGRLITHDELLDKVWPETYVQPQVLRTYVLELRRILGDDAGNPRFILTMPKRGYRFVAAVTESNEHVPAPVATRAQAPAAQTVLPGFVNRTKELAILGSELDRIGRGQRRVVFVTGEAGIGKTALVDFFCRGLLQGSIVARGECVPGVGAKEEYYPVNEALGHLCSSVAAEEICSVLSRMAPAWLAHIGRQPEQVESDSSKPDANARMPGDLCAALEEISRSKPLVLVFEDLHWADSATLNLLAALARRRAPANLLVLATFRSRGIAPGHPLRALKHDLLVRKLCTEAALEPFPRSAVASLIMEELHQTTLPPGLSEFVHHHSEGNPLFVISIVEHLIAQQILVCSGQNGSTQWEIRSPLNTIGSEVPGRLAEMVELEIEHLAPDERELLEAGSLLNIVFPAWAVAAAIGCDAAEVEERCDAIVRSLHFVERAGEDELPGGARSAFYVFAHEVYREVLYQRQPAARRAQRHVRIAERLAELFKGREADVAREMAMHFEAAGEMKRAATALRSAAARAAERNAHFEAVELNDRAAQIEMRP